ncbi:MAG TPA: SYNERG-CTERM sorting domain-containing protein [Synergistaceae bacterium]|nr:SYNERG-CTERM sorting domain-containing protein [Synergistaceae bacterium]
MKKAMLAVVSILVFASISFAYTLEVTTETNFPIDGVYTDRTEEKQAEFPNCKKALQVSASLFQNRPDTIEFGINFESPEGKRRVEVYLEQTGGDHEKVYDQETDFMWLFDTFDVWKSSEYDLSRPQQAVTGCIVICVGDVVPDPTPTPEPTPEPTPIPNPNTGASGGGCNAGFSPFAILLILPVLLLKR